MMTPPFPGMDPYLEAPGLWPDLHHRLITYISDGLQPQIRPNYRARIEERLYVFQTGRHIYPDVTVVQQSLREQPVAEAVNLPAIFKRAYDNGGYADFVDYSQPPPVPLSEEEQQWAAKQIQSTTATGRDK